jgi:hypothetical protein
VPRRLVDRQFVESQFIEKAPAVGGQALRGADAGHGFELHVQQLYLRRHATETFDRFEGLAFDVYPQRDAFAGRGGRGEQIIEPRRAHRHAIGGVQRRVAGQERAHAAACAVRGPVGQRDAVEGRDTFAFAHGAGQQFHVRGGQPVVCLHAREIVRMRLEGSDVRARQTRSEGQRLAAVHGPDVTDTLDVQRAQEVEEQQAGVYPQAASPAGVQGTRLMLAR